MVREREEFRATKKFDEADEMRKKIEEAGYKVEDAGAGSVVKKA
jgi:cysteinyl-tRNA synthetase